MFLLSGEILRVSEYEAGFKYGVRFDVKKEEWETDERIVDGRILICNLKVSSRETQ
jgi:7,8-dihydropterin-6-yl-methyl-4-(beta-D-ribofuranosyl)aminobenzene 5'-phosphate synthase